jgi:hypothetical protein
MATDGGSKMRSGKALCFEPFMTSIGLSRVSISPDTLREEISGAIFQRPGKTSEPVRTTIVAANDYEESNGSFGGVLDAGYLLDIACKLVRNQASFIGKPSAPNSEARPAGPAQVSATSRCANRKDVPGFSLGQSTDPRENRPRRKAFLRRQIVG